MWLGLAAPCPLVDLSLQYGLWRHLLPGCPPLRGAWIVRWLDHSEVMADLCTHKGCALPGNPGRVAPARELALCG
ncbi:hypothetical protein GCM10027452_30190 [Micromonospora halotolerans]